jgi:hypothetical protein
MMTVTRGRGLMPVGVGGGDAGGVRSGSDIHTTSHQLLVEQHVVRLKEGPLAQFRALEAITIATRRRPPKQQRRLDRQPQPSSLCALLLLVPKATRCHIGSLVLCVCVCLLDRSFRDRYFSCADTPAHRIADNLIDASTPPPPFLGGIAHQKPLQHSTGTGAHGLLSPQAAAGILDALFGLARRPLLLDRSTVRPPAEIESFVVIQPSSPPL